MRGRGSFGRLRRRHERSHCGLGVDDALARVRDLIRRSQQDG